MNKNREDKTTRVPHAVYLKWDLSQGRGFVYSLLFPRPVGPTLQTAGASHLVSRLLFLPLESTMTRGATENFLKSIQIRYQITRVFNTSQWLCITCTINSEALYNHLQKPYIWDSLQSPSHSPSGPLCLFSPPRGVNVLLPNLHKADSFPHLEFCSNVTSSEKPQDLHPHCHPILPQTHHIATITLMTTYLNYYIPFLTYCLYLALEY